MGEHAFTLMRFVCWLARAIFGGSDGIISTAGQGLQNPCNSDAKSWDETSRRGE